MQPKFFTFMQCTFGKDEWDAVSISTLTGDATSLQWIMEHMSRFKSRSDGARVNLLDLSYKEVKMKFKVNSVVGVGNGMFYCDSAEVTDTKMSNAPPEYMS
jgi:hypothetical protein